MEKYLKYAKYLSKGKRKQKEKEKILAQYKEDNANEELGFLENFWDNYTPQANSRNHIVDKTFQKIENIKYRKRLIRVAAIAAGIIVLFSFSFRIYYLTERNNKGNLIDYHCKTGEVKKVDLPDGSNVFLNSRSSLIFKENFFGKKREVYLFGEAFFNVKKSRRQFVVNTSELAVTVLGTSFRVSSYPDDSKNEVYLKEGSIELSNKIHPHQKVVMRPKQLIYQDKTTGSLELSNLNDDLGGYWTEGKMKYYDMPLKMIAKHLERKYDVEIRFSNFKVEQLRYTAEFKDESIDEIINVLVKTNSLTVKKVGEREYLIVEKDK